MDTVDSCVGANIPCSDSITSVCRFTGALLRLHATDKDRYQSLNGSGLEQVILLSPYG